MPVKWQASLQAKTVPCPQPYGPNPIISQEALPDPLSLAIGNGDLVAVLARVSRARHIAIDPKQHQTRHIHKPHVLQDRLVSRHHGSRLRPLDCNQGTVIQDRKDSFTCQIGAEMGEICILVSSIDHDEQTIVVGLSGHEIVKNPTLGV